MDRNCRRFLVGGNWHLHRKSTRQRLFSLTRYSRKFFDRVWLDDVVSRRSVLGNLPCSVNMSGIGIRLCVSPKLGGRSDLLQQRARFRDRGCRFWWSTWYVPTFRQGTRFLSCVLSFLGGVIYPIMFRQLRPKVGFGWTVRIIGFMALGLLTISNAIMKPRLPPKAKGTPLFDITLLKEPAYVAFTIGLFLTFTGLYMPLYFGPTYGSIVLDMTLDQSFYLTAITNGASMAGCIVPSLIGDRIGPLNIIIPCTFITGALAFIWIGINNIPGFQVFLAVYGFFTGCLITLPNPILVELSPDLQRVGTRVGMCFSIAAFGLLIGSPSGGALINIFEGDFLKTQLFGGFFLCGGATFFAITKTLMYFKKK